jgi:hypothetical protein
MTFSTELARPCLTIPVSKLASLARATVFASISHALRDKNLRAVRNRAIAVALIEHRKNS